MLFINTVAYAAKFALYYAIKRKLFNEWRIGTNGPTMVMVLVVESVNRGSKIPAI